MGFICGWIRIFVVITFVSPTVPLFTKPSPTCQTKTAGKTMNGFPGRFFPGRETGRSILRQFPGLCRMDPLPPALPDPVPACR